MLFTEKVELNVGNNMLSLVNSNKTTPARIGVDMGYQAVLERSSTGANASAVSRQQMPLPFLHAGETARVVSVRGKGDMHHHLENLGFVEGAEVRVIAEHSGNLIVEVKGSLVAIDKSVAMKIIVS